MLNFPVILSVFRVFGKGEFYDLDKEVDAKKEADKFRDGECEPNDIKIACKGEYISGGNEDDELSSDADDEAVNALTEGLAGRASDDGEACEDEGIADYTECDLTDTHHFGGGVEQAEERFGEELEDSEAEEHIAYRGEDCESYGGVYAVAAFCAEVIRDDGDHTCIESENGHKYEALELEVDTEDVHCGLAEADEDHIHREGHNATYRLHEDGRNTDAEHFFYVFPFRKEVFNSDTDFLIDSDIENDTNEGGDALTDNGGDSGTLNAHLEIEDEYGVENDIRDSTRELDYHTEK